MTKSAQHLNALFVFFSPHIQIDYRLYSLHLFPSFRIHAELGIICVDRRGTIVWILSVIAPTGCALCHKCLPACAVAGTTVDAMCHEQQHQQKQQRNCFPSVRGCTPLLSGRKQTPKRLWALCCCTTTTTTTDAMEIIGRYIIVLYPVCTRSCPHISRTLCWST